MDKDKDTFTEEIRQIVGPTTEISDDLEPGDCPTFGLKNFPKPKTTDPQIEEKQVADEKSDSSIDAVSPKFAQPQPQPFYQHEPKVVPHPFNNTTSGVALNKNLRASKNESEFIQDARHNSMANIALGSHHLSRPQTMFQQRSHANVRAAPEVSTVMYEPSETSMSYLIQAHNQDKLGQLNEEVEQDNAIVKYWRSNQDPQYLHQIDRRLEILDDRVPKVTEVTRFNTSDVKGQKKTLYIKQVMKQNDCIQTVVELDQLELLNNREDRWPLQPFRKSIQRMRIKINLLALNIIKRKSFEAITILIIVANCTTLTMSKADQEPTETEVAIENVFQGLYTVEMLLKILGQGFVFNQGAYMRDSFNILDFFIVMSAYLSMMQEEGGDGGLSLSSLRAFRVLKPLRAVNNIPGLRLIVQSILSALPLLKDTIIVLLFFFLIFAIGGVNLFSGMLRQRCIEIETGDILLDENLDEVICGQNSKCDEGYFCGKRILNPNYDVTSFDNIFWALLAIFQCVTLEGWSDMMVLYQKVFTYYVFLFFVPLVFIGAFFLLNLTLAVINTSFNDAQERIKQQKADQEAEQLKMVQNKTDEVTNNKKKAPKEGSTEIGITQFFTAKRAALRMRDFAKKYHMQKQLEKDQNQILVSEANSEANNNGQSPRLTPRTQRPLMQDLSDRSDVVRRSSDTLQHLRNSLSKLQLKPGPDQVSQAVSSSSLVASMLQIQTGAHELVAKKQRSSSSDFAFDKEEKPNQPDVILIDNQTITEEEVEDGMISRPSVQEFLQNLKNINIDESDAILSMSDYNFADESWRQMKPMSSMVTDNCQSKSTANMVMAFNDLRRANAHDISHAVLADHEDYVPEERVKNSALERIRKAIIKKEKYRQEVVNKKINDELDYDKVIENRRKLGFEEVLRSTTNQDSRQPDSQTQVLYLNENEHEYDLSFIQKSNRDIDEGRAYLSDIAVSEKRNKSMLNSPSARGENEDSDSAESVILSDSSIASAVEKYKKKKRRHQKNVATYIKKSTIKGHIKKDMGMNLQRRLTSNFDNRSRVRLEDQDQDQDQSDDASTIFGAQSVKQQIDIYSSLNVKASVGVFQKQKESERLQQLAAEKKAKVKGFKMAKAKAKQAMIYKDLDVREFDIHKYDAYATLDRKRQKIVINPGVDYESTSQNDVFELRHKKIKSMQPGFNQFVKVHDDSVEIQRKREKEAFKKYDEDELADLYIKSKFEPYQLKRKLNSQKADEVHLEDDDEDALVLQQQPYETVMQVSKSDLLNHLSTKFITRRSDIIVSSTLSITLTPLDKFKPTQFLKLQPEDINNWVEARSDFRALSVNQAQLDDYQASESEMSDVSEPSNTLNTWGTGNNLTSHSASQADHSNVSSVGNQATSKVHVGKNSLKLPRTLLSNPIPPDQVMLLSEQDKRDYNIQRQKFELEVRKMLKQEKDQLASEQKFTLEEARQLIEGGFWEDEEEEEKKKSKEKITKKSLFENSEERSIFLGRGTLDDDMRLDQFEVAVRKIFDQKTAEKEQSLQELLSTSLIPESIRREFNLPEDQPDVEINFQQVRLHDISVSNKHQVWSGQEILSTSLNSDQAEWVTSKISSVRVWPKGKYNYVKKLRALLKMHCMNPVFENSMTFCVLLNTVVMSMDKHGQDKESEIALMGMNEMFTWIFIYEMCVKLLAIGPKKYTSSKWNLLDGGVVLLSIMELIVESTQSDSSDGGSSLSAFRTVKVFRTFRVMRVARILRALHSMQVIIGVITRSFRSFMYVVILLFLFVFIYALLGIQIYQGKYDFGPNEELPRGNFEDFGIAFVTVFQVLTMENWQEVMYASMRSARGSSVFKALTAIFYVSWIFIGNFILLNLFLAILIDSFNSEESETSASHEEHQLAEQKASEAKQKETLKLKIKRMKKLGSFTKSKSKHLKKQFIAKQDNKKVITFTGTKQANEMEMVEDLDDLNSKAIRTMLIKNKVIKDREAKNRAIKIPLEIECENSIYIFNRAGCFRKLCYYIQQHKYFDRFIMFLIAVSSLQLAFETYIVGLPKDDPVMIGNAILGQIFTYLFMLEFLFKLVALGLIMENGSYLRESWNILDFFIVMTSLVDQMLSSSDIAALKILRMLRILRPLRVVSHNVQLKMIVIALLDAGGSILNVIIVVLVVWLMFAIFAVNTYKGHFFYCSIEKYDYSDKYECETKGGEWMRYDSNFDNVGQAMMTLFIVSSLEGWPNIMNQAMDITKEDRGPAYQGNVKQAIFFIVFILIGSFFFLNFFIGVLFLKYSEAQKREVAGFTEEQLFWNEMQVMILNAKVPHNALNTPNVRRKWKTKAYNLVTSHTFEVCIIFIIFLNMLQMALQFEGSSESYNQFMEMTNFVFTAIFIAEAILKLFAFGWSYFGTSWNKFDFFVVISSILDISLTFYQDAEGGANEGGQERQQSALSVAPQLARVLRVLRVSRVLRIAGHYKGLQSLFNTIMYSVSALINVFMLLMLFFFILATLGQFMFNGVKEGQAINEYKNFQVFDRSFLLLFSISTGEDWNRIMYDCSQTAPDCVEGLTCGSEFAPVYFIAFILLVTYVMLNLFILVIIQQFQKLYLDQGGPLQLFARDYEIIVNTWVKFTTRNRCRKLKEKFLQEFLKSIPAPLGLSDKNEAQLKKEVLKMGFKSEDGFIYFNELLYRILRNQYGCFKLNTKMQIAELVTQFKLFNLTMRSIKQDKIDIQERFLSKVGDGGKDSFNPFLTQMYYRISFLAWFNLTRRRARRLNAQLKQAQKGNEKVNGHFLASQNLSFDTTQDECTQYEAVEIEVDHFSEYSVSSEEEDALADPTGIPLKRGLDKSSHKKLHSMQSAQPRDTLSPPQSRLGGSQMSKNKSRRANSYAKLKSFDFRGQLASTPNFQINDAESRGSKIANKYLSPHTNSMIQKLYQSKKHTRGLDLKTFEDQLTLKSRQSVMGFATTSEIQSPMVKPSLFSKLKRAQTLSKMETRQPVSPEHQTEGSRKDLTLQIEESLDDD